MKKLFIFSLGVALLLSFERLFAKEKDNLTLINNEALNKVSSCEASSSKKVCDEMEFVEVGDKNNQQDESTGYGAVSYDYDIGKYDVTAEEYCAFLNAVARTNNDPYGLYDLRMQSDVNIACIQRWGSPSNYTYTIIEDEWNRGKFPITYVSWYSAIRFCNWMDHGCPTGDAVTKETTEKGAYSLTPLPTDPTQYIIHEYTMGKYFIPTENEWYKAAYYLNHGTERPLYWNYPTQSDYAPANNKNSLFYQANYRCGYIENVFAVTGPPYLTPVGTFSSSPGPSGTYDMGGNVFQMTSSRDAKNSEFFIARGGSWNSSYSFINYNDLENNIRRAFDPCVPTNTVGFRLIKRRHIPL